MELDGSHLRLAQCNYLTTDGNDVWEECMGNGTVLPFVKIFGDKRQEVKVKDMLKQGRFKDNMLDTGIFGNGQVGQIFAKCRGGSEIRGPGNKATFLKCNLIGHPDIYVSQPRLQLQLYEEL